MKLFGLQIELVLFLQLAITAIIICVYAVLTSLQEAKSSQLSDGHMIVLISFLVKHHARIKSLPELAEAKQKDLDDETNKIHWLSVRFNEYQDSGDLPSKSEFEGSKLWENLFVMLIAPLAGPVLIVFYLIEGRQYKLYRVTH